MSIDRQTPSGVDWRPETVPDFSQFMADQAAAAGDPYIQDDHGGSTSVEPGDGAGSLEGNGNEAIPEGLATSVDAFEPERAKQTGPLDGENEISGKWVILEPLGSGPLGGDSEDGSQDDHYLPDGYHNESDHANGAVALGELNDTGATADEMADSDDHTDAIGNDGGWDDGSDNDSDKPADVLTAPDLAAVSGTSDVLDALTDSPSPDVPTPESALATPERKLISDDMRKAAIALLVVMEEDEEDYEPLGNDLFSVYIEPHLSNYDYDEATLADLTNPEFMREASEYDKLVAKMIRSMRGIGPKLDDKERARYAELHDKFDGGIVGRMDDVEVAINTCVDRWGPVLNAAPALMVGGAFVSAEEGSEDDDSPKTLKAQIRAVARELLSEDDRKKYDALVAQAIEHHTSRDLSEIGDLVDPDEKSHSAVAADLEGQIRDIIATTREDATQRVLEVARYVLHLNKMSTVA